MILGFGDSGLDEGEDVLVVHVERKDNFDAQETALTWFRPFTQEAAVFEHSELELAAQDYLEKKYFFCRFSSIMQLRRRSIYKYICSIFNQETRTYIQIQIQITMRVC